jgi:hypothetical protein
MRDVFLQKTGRPWVPRNTQESAATPIAVSVASSHLGEAFK